MSKKILVIEDWELLTMKLIGVCEKRGNPLLAEAEIEAELLDYELKDVIEFEGIVSPHEDANEVFGVSFHGRCILLNDTFKVGDKHRFFVLKPKKPEVKDEKENLPKM